MRPARALLDHTAVAEAAGHPSTVEELRAEARAAFERLGLRRLLAATPWSFAALRATVSGIVGLPERSGPSSPSARYEQRGRLAVGSPIPTPPTSISISVRAIPAAPLSARSAWAALLSDLGTDLSLDVVNAFALHDLQRRGPHSSRVIRGPDLDRR